MAGTFATTAIITKGLTCAPVDPCKSGLITTAFSLYCDTVIPPTVKKGGGGGGYYPRNAWNKFDAGDIHNLYKPVPAEQQYYVVPRDKEADYFRRYKVIKLNMKLGDRVIEKEYTVSESRARIIINAANIVDATLNNIKIAATNITRRIHDITVKLTNLKRKR